MLGKSNEEILAGAKPLVDEVRAFADDPSFELWVGSKQYTGKQLCDEVLNLTPFGRWYISAWHDANGEVDAYQAKKKIADLKKSLNKRLLFVVIAGVFAMIICFNTKWEDGWAGFCRVVGVLLIFAAAVIFFQKKGKEVKELESMKIVH